MDKSILEQSLELHFLALRKNPQVILQHPELGLRILPDTGDYDDAANKICAQGKEGKEERLRYILPNFCNIYLNYTTPQNDVSMTSQCHSILIKSFRNRQEKDGSMLIFPSMRRQQSYVIILR